MLARPTVPKNKQGKTRHFEKRISLFFHLNSQVKNTMSLVPDPDHIKIVLLQNQVDRRPELGPIVEAILEDGDTFHREFDSVSKSSFGS